MVPILSELLVLFATPKALAALSLFLDLASAFHHLIRETVVGSFDGENLGPVLQVLHKDGNSVEKFRCFSQLPGILAELGVPEPIVRLLRDIHLGTWCTLHDQWLLRTHRGTRPGSPLRTSSSMPLWLELLQLLTLGSETDRTPATPV